MYNEAVAGHLQQDYCVSCPEDNRILYLSPPAQKRLGQYSQVRQAWQLYGAGESWRQAYLNAPLDPGGRFWVFKLWDYDAARFPHLLMSKLVSQGDQVFRLDLLYPFEDLDNADELLWQHYYRLHRDGCDRGLREGLPPQLRLHRLLQQGQALHQAQRVLVLRWRARDGRMTVIDQTQNDEERPFADFDPNELALGQYMQAQAPLALTWEELAAPTRLAWESRGLRLDNFIAGPAGEDGLGQLFFVIINCDRFPGHTDFVTDFAPAVKSLLLEHSMLRAFELAAAPLRAANDVAVTLLGGFELKSWAGHMTASDVPSRQSCLLLLYLLCNRGRVVPAYELAEALWPEQLIDNPYGMVKNVAFRIRKQMERFCDQDLIQAYHGTYVLNDKLNFMLDIDIFDDLLRRYYGATGRGDLNLLLAAINIYRGGLLPGFCTELWLIARCQYYENAYKRAVLDYTTRLREQGEYDNIYSVLHRALALHPQSAELHLVMALSLAADKGPPAARQYYLSISPLLTTMQRKMLQERLGSSVTES